jgi:DNA-binding transcriptional ArsR family regulator
LSHVRFGLGDVTEIRFCVSPLWETVASLWALADPARHAVHLSWIRPARALARRRELAPHVELLTAFARPATWLPDFLTPPPAGPLAQIDEELATVAVTEPDRVTGDILATERHRPVTLLGRAVAEDPVRMLPRLVAALRAWHDAAIAPCWPTMRALLEADIAYRSRQLAEGGLRQLFDTLHPTVRWHGDRLVCDDPWGLDLDLRGRGLPLMPSVFVDRRVLLNVRDASPPGAVYPVRAVATMWEGRPAAAGGAGLDRVLGPARARLLWLLQSPSTTSELARRTGLSPGSVSQHLRALHEAGLVSRSRQGRQVLYLGTEVASALLRANGLAE